jgi:pSer/pThr/pTyr-binding forkhead associated (FHA) protein
MTDNDLTHSADASEEPHASDSHTEAIVPEADEPMDTCLPPVHEAGYGRLVVKRSGAETDIEFPINPPATIGRFDPGVGPIDIDLGSMPEGSYVSRKHAKITCDGGVWQIVDLGSSNGTFVLRDDFERVETADLHDGQEIALGNARFVFHLVAVEAEPEPEPEPAAS